MFKFKSIWAFSVQLYEQDNVKDSLLELQDQSADISLLLILIWFGLHHGQTHQQTIDLIIESSEKWQKNILIPLRAARQNSKAHPSLYKQLKQAEIKAEKHAMKDYISLIKARSLFLTQDSCKKVILKNVKQVYPTINTEGFKKIIAIAIKLRDLNIHV